MLGGGCSADSWRTVWGTRVSRLKDGCLRETGTDAKTVDDKRQAAELLSRISTLYGASGRWTGKPTADQRTQLAYYQNMARTLGSE